MMHACCDCTCQHLATFIDRYDRAREDIFRNCMELVEFYLARYHRDEEHDTARTNVQKRLMHVLYNRRPFDAREIAEAVHQAIQHPQPIPAIR